MQYLKVLLMAMHAVTFVEEAQMHWHENGNVPFKIDLVFYVWCGLTKTHSRKAEAL